ncbi:MAG: DUF6754 domain-containing protein [Anaerolineales bacterium]|jgi:hypothetical protein
MNNILEITGLVVVLIAAGLLLGLTFIRRKTPPVFREIPAYTRLKRAIGISVEDGTRLHISLGRGGLQTPHGAPALAGLAMLRHLTEQTSVSDEPPIVTSGTGDLAILSRDTLQAGYKAASAEDLYNPATGRLTGLTPYSYVAGAIPAMRDEDVSANAFIGHFGSEVALLTDAADRANRMAIAAADDPAAQAVLYASVDDPLIGEELFAAGAYIDAGASHRASLQVQDILRWVIILILLGGSALKLVGII